jgi:hypothetical protein
MKHETAEHFRTRMAGRIINLNDFMKNCGLSRDSAAKVLHEWRRVGWVRSDEPAKDGQKDVAIYRVVPMTRAAE